ncbi:UbiA prenyltransferase family protein [Candidatus Gottesmanbacteria bacterium]|nr:UbiA prenyltransferase family protein [Candidatus Gottesmanbacteria bacterium]
MNKKSQYIFLLKALRPHQWVKNLSLFASIIFTGQLFNPSIFILTVLGFIVFSLLSSASYLLNDIIDAPLDRLHPEKKHRPIAAGLLSPHLAFEALAVLALLGLAFAFILSPSFFIIASSFFLLHVGYSLYFKKVAVLDILAISLSFILRVLAGEVLTGYHLSVWLLLTVVFLSLFIATSKRKSELELVGSTTRPSLLHYRERLLDFYASTFANATLITYSLFAYLEVPPHFSNIRGLLTELTPNLLGRKWLMITIPFVIVGIMRYAQLIYEKQAGEKPERLITSDLPLITSILLWGVTVIFIIYVA